MTASKWQCPAGHQPAPDQPSTSTEGWHQSTDGIRWATDEPAGRTHRGDPAVSTRRQRIEAQRRAMGWQGSYALTSVGAGISCMECGGHIVTETAGQLALFRHGGYGATLTVTRRWCPTCGWDAGEHRTETNPR